MVSMEYSRRDIVVIPFSGDRCKRQKESKQRGRTDGSRKRPNDENADVTLEVPDA